MSKSASSPGRRSLADEYLLETDVFEHALQCLMSSAAPILIMAQARVRHICPLRIRRPPHPPTPGALFAVAILAVAETAQQVDTSPEVVRLAGPRAVPAGGSGGGRRGGGGRRQSSHAVDNGAGRGKLRWQQQQEKQQQMLAAQQQAGSQATAEDIKTYPEYQDYAVQGQQYEFEAVVPERTEPYYAEQFSQLREMGFENTYEQLIRQLEYAQGNVERAAYLLRQIAPDNEKKE
uniref:UBA domain-containing protein n=1 Tax=Globodera rostochiensis TaxID=31243 RepID=A0A914H2N6_GLORO